MRLKNVSDVLFRRQIFWHFLYHFGQIYDKYFRQFAKTKQLKLVRVSVSFMEKEGAFIRDFLSVDKNS